MRQNCRSHAETKQRNVYQLIRKDIIYNVGGSTYKLQKLQYYRYLNARIFTAI